MQKSAHEMYKTGHQLLLCYGKLFQKFMLCTSSNSETWQCICLDTTEYFVYKTMVMKRILLATAITIGICHIATAQTSTGNGSTNGPSVSSSRTKTKGTKAPSDTLNDRKMYNWKDGQRATPTGHEATGTGGSAAPLPKDSATMQGDSTRRYQ
jgi:hypothetical protein